MINENSISVSNLTKMYGKTMAVNNVSFEAGYGEIFGLIGPDGAGKTTIFKILSTLLSPKEGKVLVAGYDVVKEYKTIRNIIGYMPGKSSLYRDLTITEHLEFFASLFKSDLNESYSLIEPIYKQLEPFKNRQAGKLSGGMKQKLALCCALIHRPKILFLDEPTTGVDAVSRKEFWDLLKNFKDKGLSIMVSTPYMDEAGKCDRIGLIHNGSILDIDTPEGIKKHYTETLYAIKCDKMYEALKAARECSNVKVCYISGNNHHIVANDNFSPEIFIKEMENKGLSNIKIDRISADIEDVFINLMGGKSNA